jgi:hypothetical protein
MGGAADPGGTRLTSVGFARGRRGRFAAGRTAGAGADLGPRPSEARRLNGSGGCQA